MGNPRSVIWRDSAGRDPETGDEWRVCDMVNKLEAALGRSHKKKRVARWQNLYNGLSNEQRQQYTQAKGDRPTGGG